MQKFDAADWSIRADLVLSCDDIAELHKQVAAHAPWNEPITVLRYVAPERTLYIAKSGHYMLYKAGALYGRGVSVEKLRKVRIQDTEDARKRLRDIIVRARWAPHMWTPNAPTYDGVDMHKERGLVQSMMVLAALSLYHTSALSTLISDQESLEVELARHPQWTVTAEDDTTWVIVRDEQNNWVDYRTGARI